MSQAPPLPSAKPLKRPTQARAKFTVQAIFDALVRIWQRDGWTRLTTRSIALETGISVGTLYDYFPNKTALLSAYVRHCIEVLLHAIDQQAVQPADLAWQQRIHQLVRLTCGVDTPELPWFHPDMLTLEAQMAEPKHHRRVHDELAAAWQQVFDACTDLSDRPAASTVHALQLSLWGGRRYALLVQLDPGQMRQWAAEMGHLCVTCVADQSRVSSDTCHPQ
jgi:AcrR family transcriptional regulator